MPRGKSGFTLIELMIVIVVIGILAAISIPNLILMANRAKEGSTKANMHTFQLVAEDQALQADGRYQIATDVAAHLPASFRNPFDSSTGSGNAWEARGSSAGVPTAKSGLVSYWTDTLTYDVKGYGMTTPLTMTLTSGR
jgi:prepilin-type N-terminal cleavage/methylation domain-containing protein